MEPERGTKGDRNEKRKKGGGDKAGLKEKGTQWFLLRYERNPARAVEGRKWNDRAREKEKIGWQKKRRKLLEVAIRSS